MITGSTVRKTLPRRLPVLPPNFFGISFGLSGLAEVWRLGAQVLQISDAIGNVLAIFAACVWGALLVTYGSKGFQMVRHDWHNPILSPFQALILIVPMLLSGILCGTALGVGRVLVIIFSSMTIAMGGLSTGQWILNDLNDECMHPGYLLPTATAGLVGSIAASNAHLHLLAQAWFGVGIVSWLLVASIVLNRLFIRPRLSPALTPVIALEAGPPMVAGVAYHLLHPGPPDIVAAGLGGYAVLMVMLQVRLTFVYAKLSFTPGFWSFTFPTAAVGLVGLTWLQMTRPTGTKAWAVITIAFVTLVIGSVAVRSVLALARHQFFPAPAVTPLPASAGNVGAP
jgi:tellurite resistance protein